LGAAARVSMATAGSKKALSLQQFISVTAPLLDLEKVPTILFYYHCDSLMFSDYNHETDRNFQVILSLA